MKLFLISQRVNNDYDTYSDAVVRAETPEEAKRIHPNGTAVWGDAETEEGYTLATWADPRRVTVTLLGEAIDPTPGVVCAAFNAG